jgi:hypothetical protein
MILAQRDSHDFSSCSGAILAPGSSVILDFLLKTFPFPFIVGPFLRNIPSGALTRPYKLDQRRNIIEPELAGGLQI